MAKIKSIAKAIVPPVIISAIRILRAPGKAKSIFSGNYSSWAEAKKQCSGYESEMILEKCKNALLKVKNGEAVYERDSVIFDEIEYSWGLLAGLQKAALDNDGKLTVLDFGGSLGSSYFQNKGFLNGLHQLQWCIVEQAHFVETGRDNFENNQIKFYYTIEECLDRHKPNVLLLSGVLQYLSDPYKWVQQFISLKMPYIIIDRTAFIDHEKDILTVQNIPSEIYEARYPAWFFDFKRFLQLFKGYTMLAQFNAHEGYIIELENGLKSTYKGIILQYDRKFA